MVAILTDKLAMAPAAERFVWEPLCETYSYPLP